MRGIASWWPWPQSLGRRTCAFSLSLSLTHSTTLDHDVRLRLGFQGRSPSTTTAVSVRAVASQPYGRVWNFSAGPACLPLDVLERAQDELLNWGGSGVSVMEMSHRGKEFQSIIAKTEGNLRTLLGVPDNYKVLFARGGGVDAV